MPLLQVLPTISRTKRTLARIIDFVVAVTMGLVFAPVWVAAACAVACTSRGPVIFRQVRVGETGEHFEVLKFRTMIAGTHEHVLADSALRQQYEKNDFKLRSDDPRITRVGRFLRKTSLDELPQLMNVVRGQMSLVGIRPLLPQELARRSEYDQDLYRLLKPGLTGLWQVEGRSGIGDDHRVELDRRFVETWKLSTSLWIIARTPRAVLVGAGAH